MLEIIQFVQRLRVQFQKDVTADRFTKQLLDITVGKIRFHEEMQVCNIVASKNI